MLDLLANLHDHLGFFFFLLLLLLLLLLLFAFEDNYIEKGRTNFVVN
jgi:hypothetical protein